MYGDNAEIPLLFLYALFNWHYTLPVLIIAIFLIIVPIFRIFKKAGHAWWKVVIPIYNIYIFAVVIGVPWWYLLLILIPFVNVAAGIYFTYLLSKRFGFGVLFTLGLIVAPYVFLPILGYGNVAYIQPDTEKKST